MFRFSHFAFRFFHPALGARDDLIRPGARWRQGGHKLLRRPEPLKRLGCQFIPIRNLMNDMQYQRQDLP